MTSENLSGYPEDHPLFVGKTSWGTHKVLIFAEFEIDDETSIQVSSRTLNPVMALPFDYALGDTVAQAAIQAWKDANLNPTGSVKVQTGSGVATVPTKPGQA